jgi:predicted dehydrogenase
MRGTGTVSRRDFLARSGSGIAAAAAAPYVITSSALGANGKPPASERITLASVGCGGQGRGNLGAFLGQPDVEVVAVCDVYETNRNTARDMVGPGCAAYNDFREVMARPDIDAVCVATPDHWHALITIEACRNGKDVYCEKPLALTIAEGREMVKAARQHGRVVQVGTQQRSRSFFRDACEWVRCGRIGDVKLVRCWFGGNEDGGWVDDSDPPPGLDWNMYLGPAPWVPFNERRFLWNFRWFRDYSGGIMTDWGVHLIDIAQWGMGTDFTGPRFIESTGEMHKDGIFEFPAKQVTRFEYDGFVLEWYAPAPEDFEPGTGYGTKFYGTEGEIHVNRSGYNIHPKGRVLEPAGPGEPQLYRSPEHHRDFLNCMRTRQRPVSDVEIGHRATTVCHLSNIAYWTGRRIEWDPATERIVNDPGAERFLRKPYRTPWHL